MEEDKERFLHVWVGSSIYMCFAILGIALWSSGLSSVWGVLAIISGAISIIQFIRVGIREDYKIHYFEKLLLLIINIVPVILFCLFMAISGHDFSSVFSDKK